MGAWGPVTIPRRPLCIRARRGAKCYDRRFRFFFSSRRRHTRFDCDWSSDVCSSDLLVRDPRQLELFGTLLTELKGMRARPGTGCGGGEVHRVSTLTGVTYVGTWEEIVQRSEERRVGKECRSRRSPYH